MEVTSITKSKNVRLQKSQVKTVLVWFYDSKWIYHHAFVPEGQTVPGNFLFECSGTSMEEDSPCLARVLSTRHLVSSSRQRTGSPGSCCTRKLSPKTSVRPTPLIYPPVIIFCSPNWSYHWNGACLKIFKTSKQMWHRVFGPYHKNTCIGPSILCYIVPLDLSMQKGCTLNKIQIVLKSFVL